MVIVAVQVKPQQSLQGYSRLLIHMQGTNYYSCNGKTRNQNLSTIILMTLFPREGHLKA